LDENGSPIYEKSTWRKLKKNRNQLIKELSESKVSDGFHFFYFEIRQKTKNKKQRQQIEKKKKKLNKKTES